MLNKRMCRRCVAALVLGGALCGGVILLQANANPPPLASSNVATSAIVAATTVLTGGPYDLPEGTIIRDIHVLSMPGSILSATESTPTGSQAADLLTLGYPVIDGVSRDPEQAVDWGETVDVGAFYNAGNAKATVTFDSRLIVDLAPGEVIFTSSTATATEIRDDLVAEELRCKCRCICEGAGCAGLPPQIVPCGDAPTPNDCESLNEEACDPPGDCDGQFVDCERVYMVQAEP